MYKPYTSLNFLRINDTIYEVLVSLKIMSLFNYIRYVANAVLNENLNYKYLKAIAQINESSFLPSSMCL